MSDQYYRAARDIAMILLRAKQQPTEQDIRVAVEQGMKVCESGINAEQLTADLLHSYNVFAGSAAALDDPRDHREWLAQKRAAIPWHFWHRYETWLEQNGLPASVVRSLGDLTDEILRRLEDPSREGEWDRRGMVVGSVQSGKTANYIGLICKAVDAGYRIVVVLAGMHNNLRSQTQLRIDEGFLGFDTEKDRKLNPHNKLKGVGLFPTPETLHVMSLTSSADDGDFKQNVASAITSTLGGIPTVLVVKKHGRILKTLKDWLIHLAQNTTIRNVPLLLIDDEADQASINTKTRADLAAGQLEDENDVSTINKRIREVLAAFEKKAYVGYTATPFANIFINPDARGERLEDDIFPRSFILNVRPPGNYVGPARVFGLEEDPDTGILGKAPLPLVNVVDDHRLYLPPKHTKDHIPAALPESLRHAIKSFVLACAVRRARGQINEHNSMLIHVTRFVDVQGRVTDLVKDELDTLRKRIAYGDGARKDSVLRDLRDAWEAEFVTREHDLRLAAPDEVGSTVTWDKIEPALHEAVSKIEVKQINGTAKDVLDYVNHPEGYSVIAIGGDKLSRGLTLEGLSISYFLRTSRMYDTLMQMGRWFGYRPAYLDLCRLFTTRDLYHWYRHIALAEEELRREFEYMAASGLTPETYGLRVRSHSGGLIVTALNKMCHAKTLELCFAGELKQTAHFSTDPKVREKNVQVLESFLHGIGQPKKVSSVWVWQDVPAKRLCSEFFEDFVLHPHCHTLDKKRVIDFIVRQNAQGELNRWTVALINNPQNRQVAEIAGHQVGLTQRDGEIVNGVYGTTKANIQSPAHQALDLGQMVLDEGLLQQLLTKRDHGLQQLFDEAEEQLLHNALGQRLDEVALTLSRKRASEQNKAAPQTPNGRVARELRPVTHGLLLVYALSPMRDGRIVNGEAPYVGIAISFPTSHTARSISYEVNKILIQELRDAEYDN